MTDAEALRAEFERVMQDEPWDAAPEFFKKYPDGEYLSPSARTAFEAYQACHAQREAEIGKLQYNLKQAYIAGYERGHHDTVESAYGYVEEKAEDWLDEFMLKPQGGEEG